MAIASLIIAVAAILLALASAAYARRQAVAGEQVAEIEAARRFEDLTPVLEVTCAENAGVTSFWLTVRLAGPAGLDRVDTLTVTIRDDSARRAGSARPGGPSAEEIRQHVWGPCRFLPGSGPDGALADEAGRVVACERQLTTGESLVYLLEPVQAPSWAASSVNQWRDTVGRVLRLSFTMTHAEHGTWTVPGELDLAGTFMRKGPARVTLPSRSA